MMLETRTSKLHRCDNPKTVQLLGSAKLRGRHCQAPKLVGNNKAYAFSFSITMVDVVVVKVALSNTTMNASKLGFPIKREEASARNRSLVEKARENLLTDEARVLHAKKAKVMGRYSQALKPMPTDVRLLLLVVLLEVRRVMAYVARCEATNTFQIDPEQTLAGNHLLAKKIDHHV